MMNSKNTYRKQLPSGSVLYGVVYQWRESRFNHLLWCCYDRNLRW